MINPPSNWWALLARNHIVWGIGGALLFLSITIYEIKRKPKI